ncbi:hypothetical protein AB0M34_09555 [Nocardia sp. NPDC050193]
MSLLNRANTTVIVHEEIVTTDIDGNTRTKPNPVGTPCRGVIQPVGNQLVANEQQVIGFQTDDKLRLRLVGWDKPELGAQSQVVWQGRRYSMDGEPTRYLGGVRTRHTDYYLRRY